MGMQEIAILRREHLSDVAPGSSSVDSCDIVAAGLLKPPHRLRALATNVLKIGSYGRWKCSRFRFFVARHVLHELAGFVLKINSLRCWAFLFAGMFRRKFLLSQTLQVLHQVARFLLKTSLGSVRASQCSNFDRREMLRARARFVLRIEDCCSLEFFGVCCQCADW